MASPSSHSASQDAAVRWSRVPQDDVLIPSGLVKATKSRWEQQRSLTVSPISDNSYAPTFVSQQQQQRSPCGDALTFKPRQYRKNYMGYEAFPSHLMPLRASPNLPPPPQRRTTSISTAVPPPISMQGGNRVSVSLLKAKFSADSVNSPSLRRDLSGSSTSTVDSGRLSPVSPVRLSPLVNLRRVASPTPVVEEDSDTTVIEVRTTTTTTVPRSKAIPLIRTLQRTADLGGSPPRLDHISTPEETAEEAGTDDDERENSQMRSNTAAVAKRMTLLTDQQHSMSPLKRPVQAQDCSSVLLEVETHEDERNHYVEDVVELFEMVLVKEPPSPVVPDTVIVETRLEAAVPAGNQLEPASPVKLSSLVLPASSDSWNSTIQPASNKRTSLARIAEEEDESAVVAKEALQTIVDEDELAAKVQEEEQVIANPPEWMGTPFPGLRTICSRLAQRIATYDSNGRRIGTLDHGVFSADSSNGETLERPGNRMSTNTKLSSTSTTSVNRINTVERLWIHGNQLHLTRGDYEDETVLIMEMVGGRLQIVAGTVERLVMRLADENLQDPDYVDTFLSTHPFFISARNLFVNLVARFRVRSESGSLDDREYFEKWQRPIQFKTLAVLGRWVKINYEEIAADGALRASFEQFLQEISDSGFPSEAERIRRSAVTQASSIHMQRQYAMLPPGGGITTGKTVSNPLMVGGLLARPSPFPRHTSPNLLENSPLLELDPKDVAKWFAAVDWASIRGLTVGDYVAKLREDEVVVKDDALPNGIDALTERANMIRNWVALEVCSQSKVKVRRKVIEKFISIAKACRGLNDFHTSLFIVSGLMSPAVGRLRKTWDGISSKDLAAFASLEKLLDPTSNSAQYRRAYSTSKGPSVPFLPLVLKDLTIVVHGVPSTIPIGQINWQGRRSELVNFEKCRTINRTLQRYVGLGAAGPRYDFSKLLVPTQRIVKGLVYGTGITHVESLTGSAGFGKMAVLGSEFCKGMPNTYASVSGKFGLDKSEGSGMSIDASAYRVESRIAFCADEKEASRPVWPEGKVMNGAWAMAGRVEEGR
ncbi:ras guanine nucleotide exchange factor domain-containing protein [Cladochytrium replicatum]|nr:ras guanine nucleotide exchange factor domain-containing protein [Cladochytrium replicatum]